MYIDKKSSFSVPKFNEKRVFDICIAFAMLIIFLPVIFSIGAFIYAFGGGSVIYSQTRIGRYGVPFRCLKFRTMVKDADLALQTLLETDQAIRAEWELKQKLDDDPRTLPIIGDLLRKSSLDELPQIFNVLWGDMSIVGPRPIVENELERYGRYRNYYLSVRPGLTGLWQISGRSDVSYASRIIKDVWYVRNANFVLDAKIVIQTALAFFTLRLSGGR